MTIQQQKQQLRRIMGVKRRDLQQIFTQHQQAHQQNILDLLCALHNEQWWANKKIATYLAIGSELDPAFIRDWATKIGAASLLPVVVQDASPLIFRQYNKGDTLIKEKFGTQAPNNSAPQHDPDVIIVPMLSFDKNKYRLGYGGGFYDRTLDMYAQKHHNCLTIGLSYDGQHVSKVPCEPTDKQLHYIISEKTLYQ